MARAITDPAELLRCLELPNLLADEEAERRFSMRVPLGFVERMERGNPRDPLLLQVLPGVAETQWVPGYHADPVGDGASIVAPGVIHKYHGRALLVASAVCAIHCRYCFRRHFPYTEAVARGDEWEAALGYIAADPTIEEVILSGGDPLLLADGQLADLSMRLQRIPHLRRLRIHSRLPVVLPSRIDDVLLDWLRACRLQTVLVIHANHPNELDDSVCQALARLREAGIVLLNQSVLLRAVNNRVETLLALSERLFSAGVIPYYLHLLDKVDGAAHFDVNEKAAVSLLKELRKRLPGYMVPRLVRERAGTPAKMPIC